MNELSLELMYELFRCIDKNYVIICSSSTKLFIIIRKLIHIQICSNRSFMFENIVGRKHIISSTKYSEYQSSSKNIRYNNIHHGVQIDMPSYRTVIYLNNDKIRHINFNYFYKDQMIVFPKKLKSLIRTSEIDPSKIETSELKYLSCETITGHSHLFPKLQCLVIRILPEQLPLSLQVLSIINNHHENHIDISYLNNVTKLFLEHGTSVTYPPHLKYLNITTITYHATLTLPKTLETFIVKHHYRHIIPHLILNFPDSLTKIKIPYLSLKTKENKHNFTNSNLVTIIITSNDNIKFPCLPKNIKTLITRNTTIPNPLPVTLKTLSGNFDNISMIKKTKLTHLCMRLLSPSFTDFSQMKLQRLELFSDYYRGYPNHTIILSSTLQFLILRNIRPSITITDNGCELTHFKFYNSYSFDVDNFSDLLKILKMPSLRHTFYIGDYHTNIAFSPNLEYLKIHFRAYVTYIITKELFPKLKKLSLPYENSLLHKMTFPKSLRSIQINIDSLRYVSKSITYVTIV